MQPASPPIKSKYSIPRHQQTLVQRPRLLDQLRRAVQRLLTLVSAPAGFGKTTLLSEWAIQAAQPVAWFSLDSGDNDPAEFVRNLVYAFESFQAGGAKSLTSPDPSLPPQFVLQTLLNELGDLNTGTILVLDDYHIIQSAPVHALLAYLLDHLPNHLRLVIATRADPPIPMARLRARGELNELRVDDLRFTEQEAASFLQEVMRLPVTPENVTALEAKTEGWISGLKLAALSLQGRQDIEGFVRSFSGSHRFILDYLVEEVLSHQPTAIQQFLLQTSILDQLCAPLCDAVIGADARAQATLEQLERANLFTIALDDERHWYRYHHLFADLLRARLGQTSPELVPALHRRAAAWLDQHGSASAAVQHALAGKDFELAANIIQAHGAERWSVSDISFLNLLAQLPPEVLQARPLVGVYRAWTLVLQSRLDEAGTLLEWLLPHISASGDPEAEKLGSFTRLLFAYIHALTEKTGRLDLPPQNALDLIPEQALAMRNSADVIYARLLTYLGRFDEAVEILRGTVQRDIAAGGATAIPICTAMLIRLRLIQGRLAEAERLGREYLQYISQRDRRRYYTSGLLDIALAEVLLEKNDLAAAEELAHTGLQQNLPWNIPQAVLLGYLRLAQVQLVQGKLSAASETLASAEAYPSTRALPPDVENERRILRLRLDAAQGRHTSSQEWASSLPGEFSADYRLEHDYILLAHLLIEEKQAARAASLLEKLKIQTETGRRTGRLVKILLLQALARSRMGQRSAAFAALEKCLELAAAEGFLRTFLDEGEAARELLATYQRQPTAVQRKYLAHILEAFPKRDLFAAPGKNQQNLISPLTPRELEVLHCLARGDSNQAIAEKLFISLSAVKKHTGNIYRKLDAESRAQAIARSRELGLI